VWSVRLLSISGHDGCWVGMAMTRSQPAETRNVRRGEMAPKSLEETCHRSFYTFFFTCAYNFSFCEVPILNKTIINCTFRKSPYYIIHGQFMALETNWQDEERRHTTWSSGGAKTVHRQTGHVQWSRSHRSMHS
jgi:hypothetical protein